jgi:spermidine synthase
VGLGIGVIATYARPGDTVRFYEINPQVVEAASKHFGFLRSSRGTVEVVVDDARIALASERPQAFDILIVDAFSGDAIPVHLLTREAFELYFGHLKPDGVLAIHVTNRFLKLAPQVTAIAQTLGWKASVIRNQRDPERAIEGASWVIIRGRKQIAQSSRPVWTDQFSNLLGVIQ